MKPRDMIEIQRVVRELVDYRIDWEDRRHFRVELEELEIDMETAQEVDRVLKNQGHENIHLDEFVFLIDNPFQ